MHARSTTLTAEPTSVDDGIADVRETVMPAVLAMDGCLGLSMLCDYASGRCILTTAWQSHEAMTATRDRVRDLRERATARFGGRSSDVEEWEIAALHRLEPAGEESRARVTWGRVDPARTDRVVDAFRRGIVPRMDEVPGFCSLSLLVARTSGRMSLTAVYTDGRALAASRERVADLREDFRRRMGMEVSEVAEFDLVLHHMHVPELV